MGNSFFLSECCKAEVQIVFSDFPDFVGDDPKQQRIGTSSFRCTHCGKPCNILPLEEVFKIEQPKEEKNKKWNLSITRVNNGYLLKGIDSADGTPMTVVIEDNEKDDLKSHEDLLWLVMEYFNFLGSKHDKKRLQVIRKKQK